MDSFLFTGAALLGVSAAQFGAKVLGNLSFYLMICRYILEIQRLEEERKTLKTERERLNEHFEVKLRRAESLFESELNAAKMLYTRELQALREHEDALKDELAARQKMIQKLVKN